MGPETWESGNDTPVNLRGYKSKFEKHDKKIHMKVIFSHFVLSF